MRSLILRTVRICELCRRQDALDDCRLCVDCNDAIMRLMSIPSLIVVEQPEATNGVRAANHRNVVGKAPW
jgi:hypothetical protein